MPKYERHIFVCENSRAEDHPRGSCDPRQEETLRDRFKQEVRARGLRSTVRANRAGCLDQCEHGPVVVVYPEAVWYGGVTLEDVAEIIEKHIQGGEPVQRLLIPDECLNNPDCPHRRRGGWSGETSKAGKEKEMSKTEILCKKNGPLLVSGDFVIQDPDGNEFDLSGRVKISLCRCGHSENKPFCDGSHNRVGFESTVQARKLPERA